MMKTSIPKIFHGTEEELDWMYKMEQPFVYLPHEYMVFGDKKISSPPLINTSFREMADLKWMLSVQARWLPTYSHSKLKFHFGDPDKKGYPFLVFRMWHKGNVFEHIRPPFGDVNNHLVRVLYNSDLTPNWTKHPTFSVSVPGGVTLPIPEEVPVVASAIESDLEFYTRINEERIARLKDFKPIDKQDDLIEYREVG